MIKVYGMPSCPYCAYINPQIEGNPEFKYIDIGADVHALREFLALRDHRPEFDELKKEGDVCIPCFVREDGSITLEPSEVGLHSYSEVLEKKKACRIDGTGC